MPMYEFECESCGRRCEALVEIDTASIECRHCGSPRTKRVFSAQASSMHLVKTPGENRKQERKNAKLQQATKARFKETRRKQRERSSRGGK